MMVKKAILMAAVCALLLSVQASFGQDLVRSRVPLQMDFDHARFFGNDSEAYVEVYYALREVVLTYRPDSGSYTGGAKMSLTISQDTSSVVKKEWIIPHAIEDTSVLDKGQTLIGRSSFLLAPGEYDALLVASDVNDPRRIDTVEASLKIRRPVKEREMLSDIELCTSVEPSTNSASMFFKNTLEVIPNPSLLYGTGVPFLYYYVEAYNLQAGGATDDLIVRSVVTDGTGNEVVRQEKKKVRGPHPTAEVGKINLTAFNGGTYTLAITLVDSSEHLFASSTKKFFIYKPGTMVTTGEGDLAVFGTPAGVFAALSEEELDTEFAQAVYIANPKDREQYEQLGGAEPKRKFLAKFWQRQNQERRGKWLDFRIEYKSRIAYTAEQFQRGFREGWKTDRGRIYVTYGPPNEIDRFPSTTEAVPYEIWNYNDIQGGVIFVFIDRYGLGNYDLVHSTHREELYNPNWKELDANRFKDPYQQGSDPFRRDN